MKDQKSSRNEIHIILCLGILFRQRVNPFPLYKLRCASRSIFTERDIYATKNEKI